MKDRHKALGLRLKGMLTQARNLEIQARVDCPDVCPEIVDIVNASEDALARFALVTMPKEEAHA